MRSWLCLSLLAGQGMLALTTSARADEESIPVKELPRAVRKAVQDKFPKAEIEKAAREEEDGKTIFEVTLEGEHDRDIDVSLSADGKILEIEKSISFDELPGAVKKELKNRYPGARIEKVEATTKGEGGPVSYEVLLTTEVVLSAEGKIAKAKEHEDEDEDDDPKASVKGKKGKHHEDGDDDDDDDDEEDDDR